jgi:hypothetical protein
MHTALASRGRTIKASGVFTSQTDSIQQTCSSEAEIKKTVAQTENSAKILKVSDDTA